MKHFLVPVYGPDNDFRPRLATFALTPATETWLVSAHAEIERLATLWGYRVFRDVAVWNHEIIYIGKVLPEFEDENVTDAECGVLVVLPDPVDPKGYEVARGIDNVSMHITHDGVYWVANLRNDTEDFETEMIPWLEILQKAP